MPSKVTVPSAKIAAKLDEAVQAGAIRSYRIGYNDAGSRRRIFLTLLDGSVFEGSVNEALAIAAGARSAKEA